MFESLLDPYAQTDFDGRLWKLAAELAEWDVAEKIEERAKT